MSLINQNNNSARHNNYNDNNYKMSIHLLLNAVDEVNTSGQQIQQTQQVQKMQQQQSHKLFLPTVLIPSINSHFKHCNSYLNHKTAKSSSYSYPFPQHLEFNKNSDTESEAIEFLSKINHINNNINNVFQSLKRQNSMKWYQSYHQNNIHELNLLSQRLINVCHETKKKIMSNSNIDNKNFNHINSLTLPFTVNYKNGNKNDNYYIPKKKLETVHSVNVVTSKPNIISNQGHDINIPRVNLSTNFKLNNKMVYKKKITQKVGNNFSNIKRNHEMDGKPCSHCLSVEKTPEWRSGPYGSEQKICNACGLFYRKLKQKFGIEKANTIMAYRKLKCATNRRVPPEFDVPLEFISRQQQQQEREKKHTESWYVQENQSERSRDAKNTQLVSPVVTPVIKGSMILLNSNNPSSKKDPFAKPAESIEPVSIVDD